MACRIVVRSALDQTADILSASFDMEKNVLDVKQRVEQAAQIPALYQTLLQEGDTIPLRDDLSLADIGLEAGTEAILLAINQSPRDPMRELWKSVCAASSSSTSSDLQLRYLLEAVHRHIPLSDEEAVDVMLQNMFRSALVGGNAAAVRVLAKDPSIDVIGAEFDEYSDPEEPPKPWIEIAAEDGNVGVVRSLLDSGRFYPGMCDDVLDWATYTGRHIWNGDSPLREMIYSEGWMSEPFCTWYAEAISSAFLSC